MGRGGGDGWGGVGGGRWGGGVERITTCEHMCAGLGALLCAVPVVINGYHPKIGEFRRYHTEQLKLAGNLPQCPALSSQPSVFFHRVDA